MSGVYIFGAGQKGVEVLNELKSEGVNIIGFLENDPLKHNKKVEGICILGDASYLKDNEFSKVIIASILGYRIMIEQLKRVGVTADKIETKFVEYHVRAREQFLIDYAKIWRDVPGDVAEGGVFQGEFAKQINIEFPNDPLYLFDTFTGFDERDLATEYKNSYSKGKKDDFHFTNISLVMDKMINPQNVIIKKGYFPETTLGLEGNSYKFVNLDFDLYEPILAGIKYFYPRMIPGSVILIHDYFSEGYKGVKRAVDKFNEIEPNLLIMPIGDNYSISIVKSY
ncbi:methyltransferase [Sporosarcina sp. PTS2304]|uniref:TylF/MycF/NovP-related O-methyltransferase n=1 Tax=Sporosarcina sp. PTS2304 TaxID=2283194 RepID=UPI000E0D1581|nr:TylF/MycF/NovP-related O-methyltransferase [Sporosarcina sp. PTS2304]AXH98431.1 methyltransferase [Sporosarcina sp. PTS2304]